MPESPALGVYNSEVFSIQGCVTVTTNSRTFSSLARGILCSLAVTFPFFLPLVPSNCPHHLFYLYGFVFSRHFI